MTLSILTHNKMTFSMMTIRNIDSQHDDTQHTDPQHNDIFRYYTEHNDTQYDNNERNTQRSILECVIKPICNNKPYYSECLN